MDEFDVVGFPLDVEEEIPMTMQVGMVGTDGVLIASDTKWADNQAKVRSSTDSGKLRVLRVEPNMVVSCAGSMATAHRLADEIVAVTKKDEDWLSSADFRINKRIGKKVLKGVEDGRQHAQCLVAVTRPSIKLYRWEIARVCGEWSPCGQEVLTKQYAGDTANPAVFWAERYYPRKPKQPISELVPLAAHLICTAHTLNTAGIDGLEIVLCDKDGIRFVPEDSIRMLEEESVARDQRIREELFSVRMAE
jgi:hypothetical protein